LSGRELNCGVIDGAWLEIDGVYNGHPFALGSSNPDQWTDDGSKVVAQVMALAVGLSAEQKGNDDRDKSLSVGVDEAPRRSISSLVVCRAWP
jgi:glucan phosphorylase